jgi:3',5'-cyclic AMP phosphodiesterase CpdA
VLLHLSDLHLGVITQHQLARFYKILQQERNNILLHDPNTLIYPIITGDLVNTPSMKNNKLRNGFFEDLLKIGFQEPIIVQGNHDIRFKGFISGFNLINRIKTFLDLHEKPIYPIEKLKLAIIKIDSTFGGDLARGKVGQAQLDLISNHIKRVNLTGYTYLAILHHHLKTIPDPSWLSKKIYEETLDRLGIDAEYLIDSNAILRWMEEMQVPIVLHGHKHIPHFNEHAGIKIVACGSSTGYVDHKTEGLTYISYNRLNYDMNSQKVTSCTWCYEESAIGGLQHLETKIF